MNDERTLIHSFQKNAVEQIRISIGPYKGRIYLDARIYWQDGEEWRPSGKGITIRADLIDELETGLKKANEFLKKGEKP